MAENTRGVLAIELLAAAQGLDFRRPLKSSEPLQRAHQLLRGRVGFYDHDRHFAPDIEAAKHVVRDEALLELVPGEITPSAGRVP